MAKLIRGMAKLSEKVQCWNRQGFRKSIFLRFGEGHGGWHDGASACIGTITLALAFLLRFRYDGCHGNKYGTLLKIIGSLKGFVEPI